MAIERKLNLFHYSILIHLKIKICSPRAYSVLLIASSMPEPVSGGYHNPNQKQDRESMAN